MTGGFSLAGKFAVVTGAGRGLGQGIAVALAEAGAHLILVSRTQHELDETAALVRAAGSDADSLVADVADLDRLDEVAERSWEIRNRVDIVVPAAGRQLRKSAVDVTPNELRALVDLNLSAPFLLCAAFGRRMIAGGVRGRHILIGSLASRIGIAGIVPYAGTKSGVVGIVHGLSREWAPAGITVNAVLPGYFDTALTKDLLADPDRSSWVMSRIPMGRLGAVSEVGAACVYLASDAAGYVTGETIAVDGGWLAS